MAPRKAIVIASVIAVCGLVAAVVLISYHFARKGSVARTDDDGGGGAQSATSSPPPASAALSACGGNGTARCSSLRTLRRTTLAAASAAPAPPPPHTTAPSPPTATKPPGFLTSCGSNRYVALTFDDGPFTATNVHSNTPATAFVLDELKAAGVKATFFISPGGQDGHYGPGECQVLKRAIADGHEVQWHTWTHADLTLPTSNVQTEVQRCRDWIRNDCVVQATAASFTMLRPPFGYTNDKVNGELNGLGLTSITWNIDTQDWQGTTMDQIQAIIKSAGVTESAVILMHDRWYQPGLIAWIKAQFKDHQFVTASKCYQDCGATRC